VLVFRWVQEVFGAQAAPGVRASVGVNQKTFENLQRRQRRFLTVRVRITLLRFSMFSEGAWKHTPGCLRRGGFFDSFLLDKQKK